MKQKRIFLTAGHNFVDGKGTGVHHNGRDEAKEAVVLRDMIADNLRARCVNVVTDKNTHGFGRVMTWLSNTLTASDTAIEIHFDASGSTAKGCTAFVSTNPTAKEIALGKRLCNAILEASNIITRGSNGGVRDESLTYHKRLRFLHSPSVATNVLLEICFITNEDDWHKYTTNKNEIAMMLANTIYNYLNDR